MHSLKTGCLNWKNIDNSPLRPSPFRSGANSERCTNQMTQDRFNATDNRGLDGVVASLEELYTTTNVPLTAPALDVSLQASGKSRADLWQFAVNVALERTIVFLISCGIWAIDSIPLEIYQ